MKTRRLGLLLAAALAAIAPAQAQYPTKPVRLIVPFAAGSGTDTMARIVQPQFSAMLGQQLVIDNRPGAGGNLGAELAAKAPADGYTLLLISIAHAISMSLYARPGYELIQDFSPVTQLASGSFALASHPSVPARSVKEVIALAKMHPGQVNVATAGAALRLAAKLFDSMAGVRTTEVTYKGTPQAVTAVISGETSLSFAVTSAVLPQARLGKLRALAVTSARRSSIAPEIPTIAESGVPGYDVTAWYGLLAPARTASDVVARLNTAMGNALADPEVRKRFAATDFEPAGSTPEQLGAHVSREVARWAKIVKESGLTAD